MIIKNYFLYLILLVFVAFTSCEEKDEVDKDNPTEEPDNGIGYVYDIVVDNENNIWVGTGNGLYKINGTTETKYTTTEGLPSDLITCLVLDKNGKIWIGTDQGISNFTDNVFVNYNTDDGLVNNDVRSITVSKENDIWIGTAHNSVSMYDGADFTNFIIDETIGHIHTITCDSIGNIWVGSCMNGLSMYDPLLESWTYGVEGFNVFVETSYCDFDGDVWISYTGGTYQYNNESWNNIKLMDVIDEFINDIIEDSDNGMWFATGFGLYFLKDNNWEVFLTKDGLLDVNITCLESDNEGNIWIGTKNGIMSINIYDDNHIIVDNIDGYWQGKTSNNDDCFLIVDNNKVVYFGYDERGFAPDAEIIDDSFNFYSYNFVGVEGNFTDNFNAQGTFNDDEESFTWTVSKIE